MNRQNGIFIEMPDTYYILGGSDCPTTATTSYFRWKCWKNLGWSLWAFGPPFPSSKFKCSCGDVDECKRQNVGRYPTPIHWGIHFNASGGHKISDDDFLLKRDKICFLQFLFFCTHVVIFDLIIFYCMANDLRPRHVGFSMRNANLQRQ